MKYENVNPGLEDILKEKGRLITTANGNSMQPLIRPGRDTVILKRIDYSNGPEKYDVILYKRKNNTYVLHRILEKRQNDYILCGDSQTQMEYGVKKEQILAVLEGIYRGKWYINTKSWYYKVYVHIWCHKWGLILRKIFRKLYKIICRRTT